MAVGAVVGIERPAVVEGGVRQTHGLRRERNRFRCRERGQLGIAAEFESEESAGRRAVRGCHARHEPKRTSPAREYGDVLLSPGAVGDRRADDSGLGCETPQAFAVFGRVGVKGPSPAPVEDQPSGGGQDAAVPGQGVPTLPDGFLPAGIPGHQSTRDELVLNDAEKECIARWVVAPVDPEVAQPRLDLKGIQILVREARFDRRNENQTEIRVVGHGLPVVGTHAGGLHCGASFGVVFAGVFHWPSGFRIVVTRPSNLGIGFRREEFPCLSVDDHEKSALGGLHENLADSAFPLEVGQDHVLGGRVVPRLGGHDLVVPNVLPGLRAEGDNRREKKVVAAAGTAQSPIPGGAVADTDVEQVEFGVVGHGIPDCSAATELPPLAVPGLGDAPHGFVFEPVGGISGHGIETPDALAGLGLVGVEVAANPVLRSAIADEHLAADHPRRAGDRVGLAGVDGHDTPDRGAIHRIECDQTTVQGADENFVPPGGNTPVHHVAAKLARHRARDLGVIAPERLPAGAVHRVDDAPGSGEVQHTVDGQGRCFEAAASL